MSLSQPTGTKLPATFEAARSALEARVASLLRLEKLPARTEFAALKPATRVLMAGLAAWIAIVVVTTVAALLSLELSRFNVSAWMGTSGPSQRGAQVQGASAFDDIVRRPLFLRARQVEVTAAEPVPTVPQASAMLDQNIVLKGVFINGDAAKAFLLTAQDPAGIWVKVDSEVSGWRVVGIRPNEIVLDGQNQKLAVPLDIRGGK